MYRAEIIANQSVLLGRGGAVLWLPYEEGARFADPLNVCKACSTAASEDSL